MAGFCALPIPPRSRIALLLFASLPVNSCTESHDEDIALSDAGVGGLSETPDALLCAPTSCRGQDVCCVTVEPQGVVRSCTAEAACSTLILECDDSTDCGPGEGCCLQAATPSVATCGARCATRFCRASAECESGNCQAFGDLGFCAPP